ncbi:MAG: hypothetical protein WC584_04750 [Candidatus Pacearchaeota archaeon]
MSVITDFYNYIASLALLHPILITFFGGFFGGEELLLILSFASANNLIPFLDLLIFFALGSYIMDLFIFSIGKTRLVSRLHEWKSFSRKYAKIDSLVGRLTKERHVMILFYTKFVYGTRIASILFLGLKKVKTTKFLLVSAITIITWTFIVAGIGWLAGKGFNIILTLFKDVFLAISFVFFFAVIIYLIKKWVEKKILKNQRK